MDFLQMQKNIKEGHFAPLYLLYGSESFLIEEIVQNIINKVLTEDEYDFNLSTYELKETEISIAIEDALTLPFMGTNRVVIVKDPTFLTAKDSSKVEHDLKAFENYILQPVPETIFIIIAPYDKLDERKKIVKQLKKQAQVLEATPLNEQQLSNWIQSRIKPYKVEMTHEAIEQLQMLCGSNLVMIAGELEKLALYAGENGSIDKEVVVNLVSKTIEQDVFSFIDHVIHQRSKEALVIFHELVKQKEEPIKILALLARQFRIIYQVKELSERGYSQQQIAGVLKLHPYVVKLAKQQGDRFLRKYVMQFMDELAELDYKMKTGKIEKKLALELFIIKVVQTVK